MQANVKCAHTRIVKLSELKPHPANENKHPPEQIKALAKIIAKLGQRSSIVVSKRSGYITKGHGRLEAVKLLGWDEVAIDDQDYATELEELNDRVADNEIARYAEFDKKQFALNIQEMGLSLEELDMEEFGVLPLKMAETKEKVAGDQNNKFILSVFCKTENELKEIYEELTGRDFECKLIL